MSELTFDVESKSDSEGTGAYPVWIQLQLVFSGLSSYMKHAYTYNLRVRKKKAKQVRWL